MDLTYPLDQRGLLASRIRPARVTRAGRQQVMEELLPGLTDELVLTGAHVGDILANVRWYLNGQMLRQVHTGLTAISASRPLIEGAVRARVTAMPNITVLDGHDIVGIGVSSDRRRVSTARVTGLRGEGSRTLRANLVVDATGRGSRSPRWLADLGYQPPSADRVRIDLAYATRVFEVGERPFGDDIIVGTARFPGQRRSGAMQLLEDRQTLVTLAGVLGERPPANVDDFIGYAQTLATPDTYGVVRTGRPIGEGHLFRSPTYVRRRYEALTRFPAGLLVTGDAFCSFNPVYAQGMSVAAANALALRDELRRAEQPDPRRYFRAIAKTLDAPWAIAVRGDLALGGVSESPPPKWPLTGEYLARLQAAAVTDADLATALVRVNALVDPPLALLRPEIVQRVEQTGEPGDRTMGVAQRVGGSGPLGRRNASI